MPTATAVFYSVGPLCQLCGVTPAKLHRAAEALGISPVEIRNDVPQYSAEQAEQFLAHFREIRDAANRAENDRAVAEHSADSAARESAGWALFLLPSDLPPSFAFGGHAISDPAAFLARFQQDLRTGSADRPTFGAGLARDLDELRVIVDAAKTPKE